MEVPSFTLKEIKYSASSAIFQRALKLFESGNVHDFRDSSFGYHANVVGTEIYEVSVSKKRIDDASCTCYMGQNDELCKHMLAVGIAALHFTKKAGESLKELAPVDLESAKKMVSSAMKKIKAYSGPSSTWFNYQRNLDIGSEEIIEALQNLPATKDNATYLWALVMRMSKKLSHGGVDDSNGTVGNCIDEIVFQCVRYVNENPELKSMMLKYAQDDTGFGFEETLREGLLK